MNARRSRLSKRRIGLTAAAMTALLVFAGAASAHELKPAEAVASLKPYVQGVLNDPQVPFVFANISCSPGVPHLKTCTVSYDTQQTRAEEARRQAEWVCTRVPGPVQPPCGPRRPKRIAPWACTEQILTYHRPFPHGVPPPGTGLPDYTIYKKHLSRPCGRSKLLGPTFP